MPPRKTQANYLPFFGPYKRDPGLPTGLNSAVAGRSSGKLEHPTTGLLTMKRDLTPGFLQFGRNSPSPHFVGSLIDSAKGAPGPEGTQIQPGADGMKEILLLTKGPNQVPQAPHREVRDIRTLGPQETPSGAHYLLNTESVFGEGQNPADYKTIRDAYILRGEGNVVAERHGAEENPEDSQTALRGSSKFVFDAPGYSDPRTPRATLNGTKFFDVAFSIQEQNRKSKKMSDSMLYYRVELGFTPEGKLLSNATVLTQDEFRKLTGQNKNRNQAPKKNLWR